MCDSLGRNSYIYIPREFLQPIHLTTILTKYLPNNLTIIPGFELKCEHRLTLRVLFVRSSGRDY